MIYPSFLDMVVTIKNFIKRQPMRTLFFIVIAWVVLTIVNYILCKVVLNLQNPCVWFPISIFSGPQFHLSGLPYIILFLLILIIALKYHSKLNVVHLWIIGVFLIMIGNLGQGNIDTAFFQPFYKSGIQYYHDAIRIDSWHEWLGTYNENQANFLTHTRTHPPFAVLTHYALLEIFNGNLPLVSFSLMLLSSISIVLIWCIFYVLDIGKERRNLITLLFCVIPAINIYHAVSLDAFIAMFCALFLVGIVSLSKHGVGIVSVGAFVFGFVITALLTFGGIFLIGVALLVGLREYMVRKKGEILITLSVTFLLFVFITVYMNSFFHFNYFQSFLTASHLENPEGFRGFVSPLAYGVTIVENISEIALFFSLGCLATLFHRNTLQISLVNYTDTAIGIMLAGIISLGALFLAGAFRTGETARVCQFIYPYLFLAFIRVEKQVIIDLTIIAGVQTAVMQLCGNYFW